MKSAYENLIGQVQTLEGGAFKELWAVKAPSNALALAWRALWGRVPTRDNLRQRQVLSEEADISCPLCSQTAENISHLFFFCNISWRVWMMVYNWCGISSVLPLDTSVNFMQFLQGCGSLKRRHGPWSIWVASVGTIWYSRNALIFKGEDFDIHKVVDLIQVKSWTWLKAKLKGFSYSLFEWKS